MARINKRVLTDYFRSFFKQYSPLNRELFDKMRDLVDNAQCGCCTIVTIYWANGGDSITSPAIHQILFKDENDVVLAETSLTGANVQTICIPAEATQICVNTTEEVSEGGTIVITTANGGTPIEINDGVGEICTAYVASPVFIITTIPGE